MNAGRDQPRAWNRLRLAAIILIGLVGLPLGVFYLQHLRGKAALQSCMDDQRTAGEKLECHELIPSRIDPSRNAGPALLALEASGSPNFDFFPEPMRLGRVRRDPYDGQPLRNCRDEERYRLYSVGENEKDDGGIEETENGLMTKDIIWARASGLQTLP
jgi:hypothetical protein